MLTGNESAQWDTNYENDHPQTVTISGAEPEVSGTVGRWFAPLIQDILTACCDEISVQAAEATSEDIWS